MRESILRVKLRKTPHSDDIDFKALARMTAGYVGADLTDLVSQAGAWALKKYEEAILAQARASDANGTEEMQLDNAPNDEESQTNRDILHLIHCLRTPDAPEPPGYDQNQPLLTMQAFLTALKVVQPSALREGFTTVPETTWSDVGALEGVQDKLRSVIVDPIRDPERHSKRIGRVHTGGVLLWGPPGCGKTLLARAVASESRANFIAIKGPELLSKYLGESERQVRAVFARARSSVPCVVFFDELDSLAGKRDGEGASEGAVARVVAALLNEMAGLSRTKGIYVIAATNRRDMIDSAMLRPGRFGTQIFVGLPDAKGRVSIMKALLKRCFIDVGAEVTSDSEVLELAEMSAGKQYEGLSGADLEMVLDLAGAECLRRNGDSLHKEDFEKAVEEVRPSVRDYEKYLLAAAELDIY
jgi:ribosome biogenesis ATPase